MKKSTAKRIKRFMKENHLAIIIPYGYPRDSERLALVQVTSLGIQLFPPLWMEQKIRKLASLPKMSDLDGAYKEKRYRLTQDELHKLCKNANIEIIPDTDEVSLIMYGIKSVYENAHYGLIGDIIDVDDNVIHQYPTSPEIPNMEHFLEMLQNVRRCGIQE